MRIEHVALYVKDLERARDFYIKYFGSFPMMDIIIGKPVSAPIFYPLGMEPGWSL